MVEEHGHLLGDVDVTLAVDEVMGEQGERVGERDVEFQSYKDLPLVIQQQVLSTQIQILGKGEYRSSLKKSTRN